MRLLVLLAMVPAVWSYPSGAVTSSCSDLTPQHRGSSQTGASPYTVTTSTRSYTAGQSVSVLLQASSGKSFTGFLLEAREVGGQTPVGSFSVSSSDAQLLTCSSQPKSAVSHTSASTKTQIRVTWQPSALQVKDIEFHATFVQSYSVFWVDLKSLSLSRSSNGSTTSPLDNISSSGCGSSKICLSQPSGCDPAVSSSCFFMSATALSPGTVSYEMSGPSSGYIAFGFSDDQQMGNDDIYICSVGANSLVSVQHAFSTGKTTPTSLPLGNVSGVEASINNNVIKCVFVSSNLISTQRASVSNQTYYLLYAYGPSSSSGQIQRHSGTFVSSNKMDISNPQTSQSSGLPKILQAHGTLMLTSWMTTATVGMMFARYMKSTAKGQKLLGKDVWFVVHVAVMSITVIATCIAFILPFAHARDWSGGAHPVLGCLVMILSLLQLLGALLRCGPQHPRRFLFNWFHASNAVAVKALAVAAIFTGLNLVDSTHGWLMSVMGAFLGWDVLFYFLFEVKIRWKMNSAGEVSGSRTQSVVLRIVYVMGNLACLIALLVGIGTS
ncbi:putative ferric-chelate reductase 1 [Oryzias melastigma]|uniref:Putative ferric-chelate reductase 1 n=1 Tax=Oryzias melastigma TaxID=30732 RepID=A0A834C1Q0_ORYME|nr:putative ferric-chelate reductase 1 [Oryzias melastigma]